MAVDRHAEPPTEGTPAADSALRYEAAIDVDSDSTHARVVRLVGHDADVLELGCATGSVTRLLREHGCRVTGVERDAAAAARAAPACERLIVADLDTADLDAELGDETFDVVLAADVLEHLRDPALVLRDVAARLRPGGHVVASLPNIAHGSVRLALLEGRFPYAPTGLLDHTHLRFFTREGVEALFAEAGLAIVREEQQDAPIDGVEVSFAPDRVPGTVFQALARDPDATAYQFIVAAVPAERAEAGLYRGLRDLRARLRAAERTVGRQDEDIARLARESVELAEENRRLREIIEESHRQLLERDALLAETAAIAPAQAQAARDLAAVHETKAWRLATRFYRTRERLRRWR